MTGTPPLSEVGEFTDPEWSGTFDFIWDYGDNTRVFWRLLWQAAAKLDATGQDTFEDLNGNIVTETDARFYSTASVSYNFGSLFNGGENDLFVQFSVENVFGAKPDFLQLAAGHFALGEMIGRRYTLGIRAAF